VIKVPHSFSFTDSFADELTEIGQEIVAYILSHPIILSLADLRPFPQGVRQLSKEELIECRNNFFIQDYFYMVYGYKVAKAFLIDTINENLLEHLGENRSYVLSEYTNPLFSASINSLREGIQDFGLSIPGARPNSVTKEYIAFKMNQAFQGSAENLVASLSCLWVYYQIALKLNEQKDNNQYFQDSEFEKWLQILTDEDSAKTSFERTSLLINILVADFPKNRRDSLKSIFLEACDLEYTFLNGLIA
jgi:thiaminase